LLPNELKFDKKTLEMRIQKKIKNSPNREENRKFEYLKRTSHTIESHLTTKQSN
jgi:hypothetical protein